MTPIAYLNNGAVPLPNITDQTTPRRVIGDEQTTLAGTLRRDRIATKRTWRFELRKITWAEYNAIIAHLDAVGWGETTFWIDELGGTAAANSIAVYVDIEPDQRVPFGRDGAWHESGRNLTVVVKEK